MTSCRFQFWSESQDGRQIESMAIEQKKTGKICSNQDFRKKPRSQAPMVIDMPQLRSL
jgi:hypothetical protein